MPLVYTAHISYKRDFSFPFQKELLDLYVGTQLTPSIRTLSGRGLFIILYTYHFFL